MVEVTAREYKVMLEHREFRSGRRVRRFWNEAADFARSLRVEAQGEFGASDRRTVMFLETPGRILNANGVILRHRIERDGLSQLTLKCRSEDRYVAAAAHVGSTVADE